MKKKIIIKMFEFSFSLIFNDSLVLLYTLEKIENLDCLRVIVLKNACI